MPKYVQNEGCLLPISFKSAVIQSKNSGKYWRAEKKPNQTKQKNTLTQSELARVRVIGIVCMLNFKWVRQFLVAPDQEP